MHTFLSNNLRQPEPITIGTVSHGLAPVYDLHTIKVEAGLEEDLTVVYAPVAARAAPASGPKRLRGRSRKYRSLTATAAIQEGEGSEPFLTYQSYARYLADSRVQQPPTQLTMQPLPMFTRLWNASRSVQSQFSPYPLVMNKMIVPQEGFRHAIYILRDVQAGLNPHVLNINSGRCELLWLCRKTRNVRYLGQYSLVPGFFPYVDSECEGITGMAMSQKDLTPHEAVISTASHSALMIAS